MTEERERKGDIVKGDVIEALANAHFRVEIPNTDKKDGEGDTKVVMAYLAGKMRLHRIRVIVGDSVELLMDAYGGKPRIVRRL